MTLKAILIASIICGSAFGQVKYQSCSANFRGVFIQIDITHHVSDFLGNGENLQSKVELKADGISYEFDHKVLSSDKRNLKFSASNAPYLGDTLSKIETFTLFDAYPDMDRDDFFFDKLTDESSASSFYYTNWDRFGGEYVTIFYCI